MASPTSQLYERALTLAAMGFHGEATRALREVTALAPAHALAWEKLAEHRRRAKKLEEAEEAMLRAASGLKLWPAAADSRSAAEIAAAEKVLLQRVGALELPSAKLKELRDHLRRHGTDAVAMRLLADWSNRVTIYGPREPFRAGARSRSALRQCARRPSAFVAKHG